MKVPKYVQELVELGRLRPAPLDEQAKESEKNENAVYSYIFRLSGTTIWNAIQRKSSR